MLLSAPMNEGFLNYPHYLVGACGFLANDAYHRAFYRIFLRTHARQHHRRPDWRAMQFIARQIYERPTAGRIERMTEEFGVDLRYHNGQSDFEYTSDGGMPDFDEVRQIRRKSPPGMMAGRVGDTRVIVHALGPHRLMALFEDRPPRRFLAGCFGNHRRFSGGLGHFVERFLFYAMATFSAFKNFTR